MSRMMSRPRRREGPGLGQKLSESFVYIVILIALVLAGRWYFFVYRRSPQVALQSFITAVDHSNSDAQYDMISSNTKAFYPSKDAYDSKCPLAHGLAEKIANFGITNMKVTGETAEADVSLSIRKATGTGGLPGASLVNAETQPATDHYVLKEESTGWKVDLADSKLDSAKLAEPSNGVH